MPYPKPPSGGEIEPSQVSAIVTPLVDSITTAKAQAVVDTLTGGLSTFAALKARTPKYEGERIMLRCHTPVPNSKLLRGGGWFTGSLSARGNDGGVIASSGGAYHWRREKDIEDLTVYDFGAVGDGITDDSPAVIAMYNYMFSQEGRDDTGLGSLRYGIKFPAGKFFLSPITLTNYGTKVPNGASDAAQNPTGYYAAGDFLIRGSVSGKYGKQISTTIISDKSNNPVFNINHRYLTVTGIKWDGQQTVAMDQYNATSNPTGTNMLIGATYGVFNDTASNKQPFLKNNCPAGLYCYISAFDARNTGGAVFDLMDTLDTRFSEIYSKSTAAPVFKIGWSDPLNQYVGKWDHPTAVRMFDCNFQYNAAPAFWTPRCVQMILENVWLEHGVIPFDANNSQIVSNTLCMEDYRKPANVYRGRLIELVRSTPTGVTMDFDTPPTSENWFSYKTNPDGSAITNWSSDYELGAARIENHGISLDGALSAKIMAGSMRFENQTASAIWVNIGSFFTPAVGDLWRIEIDGRSGNSSIGTANGYTATSDRTAGKAIINIQRTDTSTPVISWWREGDSCVRDVKVPTTTSTQTIPAVWIQLAAYTGSCVLNVTSSGRTRFNAGICARFIRSGVTSATAPTETDGSAVTSATTRFSFHTGLAGMGASGNRLTFTTLQVVQPSGADPATVSKPVDMSLPVRYERTYRNGQEMATPVYAFIPVLTTPLVNQTVATGQPMTMTVAATDAVGVFIQRSKDGGTTWVNMNDGKALTYSVPSASAADAGQYRVVLQGNDGAGNAANATTWPALRVTSTPVTVTVT